MSDGWEALGSTPEDPVLRVVQSTTTAPIGQMVVFRSTIEEHVAKHEELAAAGHGIEAIAETFSQPAAVYDGRIPGASYVYESETHNYMGHPLVVVAKRIDGTDSSRLATAYHTSSYANRTPIWRKEDSNA